MALDYHLDDAFYVPFAVAGRGEEWREPTLPHHAAPQLIRAELQRRSYAGA
jgi:hypothetical protein